MRRYLIWSFNLFLTLLPSVSLLLSVEASLPYVTCELDGQLGNQFCIIASTLAYAWDHQAEPIFPELNRKDLNMSHNRDRVFFRLNNGPLPRPVLNVYNDVEWWKYTQIPFRPDQNLKGGVYFCWKHFHHHREKLLEVFAPSQEMQNYLKKKYGWLLAYPKTVSVHVRTYNKQFHDIGFLFPGLDYYEKAMNLFPEDTIFVVFSDRINWCKHHFRRFNKAIIFAEGNDHIQDFFLITMLKGHILSNSSFSWWSAYLDNNPKKVVVAPRYWYGFFKDSILPNEKSHIFFPDWILINTDPNAKYPEDMKSYDHYSRSLDTQ